MKKGSATKKEPSAAEKPAPKKQPAAKQKPAAASTPCAASLTGLLREPARALCAVLHQRSPPVVAALLAVGVTALTRERRDDAR